MRISCSKHCFQTQLLASDVGLESKHRGEILPFLELKGLFARILEEISFPNKSNSQKTGMKRGTSPISFQQEKRRKLSLTAESSNVHDSPGIPSPLFPPPPTCSAPGQEKLPAWRHVFEVRYVDGGGGYREQSWAAEVLEFKRILETIRVSFSEPTVVDVGHSRIIRFAQGLVATWTVQSQPTSRELEDGLLLPHVVGQDYIAILQHCCELEKERKVDIEANLKVVILPEGFCDSSDKELPFEIQLEVVVSFCLPLLFEPLGRKESKTRVAFIDECKCKLYRFLYARPFDQSSVNDVDVSFFYSILKSATPLPSHLANDAMQPDNLLPTLLPFQRRSVAWLLEREGKEVTPEGNIVPNHQGTEYSFWDEVQEGNYTWYYHRLTGMLSPEKPPQRSAYGGILAEEPGLGKTLETLALIMLNPAPKDRNPSLIRWDPETRLNVKAVKTTLIVTPNSLAGQWIDEINAHAPSLKVLVYDGWSKVAVPITDTPEEKERVRKLLKRPKRPNPKTNTGKKQFKGKGKKEVNDAMESTESNDMEVDEKEEICLDWPSYVQQYDVVITTYVVLRSDLNVARAAIQRPRREDISYLTLERPRSPLVMVEWMRVVMDEVQMAGGKRTEDMVSLLPRLASFAVSGTPPRSRVSDLDHVLKFLRVDSIVGSPRIWSQLLEPANAGEFAAFFQRYAIRTVKADVKDELTIPQQTRYLVGVGLGPVERHVYNQTLEAVLNQLGLDARGVAAYEGWEVDGTLLRSSLRKLRAICTHPQVGQLLRQGDKLAHSGVLKTMEAVLEDMKDKNWRTVMDDIKAKIQGLCVLAQLQQQTGVPNRYHKAQETLQIAEKEVNRYIEELQTAITEHHAKGEILKREIAASRGVEGQNHDAQESKGEEGHSEEDPKGKESHHAGKDATDKDFLRTPAGEEHIAKRRGLSERLREARLVLHRIKFLQGDVYHVLGGQYSTSENEAYEVADQLRRDLLRVAEADAHAAVAALDIAKMKEGTCATDLLIKIPFLDGDDSLRERFRDLIVETNRIIKTVLNEQSALLWQWRIRIIDLLSHKLNSGGDEADGGEYQRTLDDQGEAEVYLQVYAALLADRREALLNERTLLAAHDIREKKLRQTVAAMRAAAAADPPQAEAPENVELRPEHEVAHGELSERRKEILNKLRGRALRSVAIDLGTIAGNIQSKDDPQKIWAKNAIADLRRLIAEQDALHDKLDADLALIRRAFNNRIVYFRQLQEISDSVVQVEWEGLLDDAIANKVAGDQESDTKITAGRARQRYLTNLAQDKEKLDDDNDDSICVLCRCEFARGFITQCAHIFCEGCMRAWIQRREGKTCPICRVAIHPDTVQKFTVGLKEPQWAPTGGVNMEHVPRSLREVDYNMIDPEVFGEIQRIQAFGDYGSKVQTLVRHLLYIQVNDPGSKSIVFSAWADSLHIVQAALYHNGIRSLRIDQKTKNESAARKFRTDPAISVLLLHGETESAGLNVTCACRVFLLESVVHHGFELQAIARIDRLGQTRPTEVYCYYAEDTIERNILDLAARRGLSLYTKDNAAGTVHVSNFKLGDAKIDSPKAKKTQKGDFIFRIDDMLAILFPHMYEEVEFLIPAEDRVNGQTVTGLTFRGGEANEQVNGVVHRTRPRQENAIAGPSRLR